MPRNSGAYVEPAARAISRFRCITSCAAPKLRCSPVRTSNQSTGMPVNGSAFSSKPKVLRYSPVIDEAVSRSVCLRPADMLPMPTLSTISSTLDFCNRVPCFATNWLMNRSKRSSTTAGSRSTSDMKCAKMWLLGFRPTSGFRRARSSSSTAPNSKVSGHCIQESSPSVGICKVWVIMRTKTVEGLPSFPRATSPRRTPRYTCEFRPTTGMIRVRS
mmetsp:Transcript_128287/g.357074  ORF Transcript_128287/g.357074 Transcript_128287/m.357074 type:complete len:216 (+) Transcript_128287:1149-1796(+)